MQYMQLEASMLVHNASASSIIEEDPPAAPAVPAGTMAAPACNASDAKLSQLAKGQRSKGFWRRVCTLCVMRVTHCCTCIHTHLRTHGIRVGLKRHVNACGPGDEKNLGSLIRHMLPNER